MHQLVRTEFPNLTAVSQVGGVVITEFDKVKDEISKKQLEASIDERIQKQIGIRWFVEGLCGGYLETAVCSHSPAENIVKANKARTPFSSLASKLKNLR